MYKPDLGVERMAQFQKTNYQARSIFLIVKKALNVGNRFRRELNDLRISVGLVGRTKLCSFTIVIHQSKHSKCHALSAK